MTNLITNIKSAVSGAVLFGAAILMMGLGFAFVGTMALFGLAAIGVALVASLFVKAPTTDAEILS